MDFRVKEIVEELDLLTSCNEEDFHVVQRRNKLYAKMNDLGYGWSSEEKRWILNLNKKEEKNE